MSFTNDVKHELCGYEVPENLKEPIRYGLFYGFRGTEPYFLTRDKITASFVRKLLPKKFINFESISSGSKNNYCITSNGLEPQVKYGYIDNEIKTDRFGGSDSAVGAFLRGVFITAGNVCVQKAGYHLEFAPGCNEKCHNLYTLINEQGMKIDISHRGKYDFLYSKNSENISDILTFIGAMQSAMEIMNIKIMKEVRSGINRSVNCETANIERTVRASSKQADDIALIFKKLGEDKLPDDLREIARLRLDNPDMSLRDLGGLTSPPISRSGVNHRFERLSKIADELKND